MTELDPSEFDIFATPFGDPAAPSGVSNQIFLFGDNPDLQPEEADTFTIGFDYTPTSIDGLTLGATYYDIELGNRIASINIFTALSREDEFAALITRNPNPDLAQSFLDDPAYVDFGFGFTGDDIDVILDGRINNTAVTKIDGLDVNVNYLFDTAASGTFTFALNGNFVLGFDEAFTASSPLLDILDTAERQVDLRLRSNVGWTNDGWSVNAFLNHTGEYKDDVSDPEREIDSFTTLDLSIAYDLQQGGILEGVQLSLTATNVFDEDPPFFNNPNGVGFDPTNGNPLGRFVAFQLTKAW